MEEVRSYHNPVDRINPLRYRSTLMTSKAHAAYFAPVFTMNMVMVLLGEGRVGYTQLQVGDNIYPLVGEGDVPSSEHYARTVGIRLVSSFSHAADNDKFWVIPTMHIPVRYSVKYPIRKGDFLLCKDTLAKTKEMFGEAYPVLFRATKDFTYYASKHPCHDKAGLWDCVAHGDVIVGLSQSGYFENAIGNTAVNCGVDTSKVDSDLHKFEDLLEDVYQKAKSSISHTIFKPGLRYEAGDIGYMDPEHQSFIKGWRYLSTNVFLVTKSGILKNENLLPLGNYSFSGTPPGKVLPLHMKYVLHYDGPAPQAYPMTYYPYARANIEKAYRYSYHDAVNLSNIGTASAPEVNVSDHMPVWKYIHAGILSHGYMDMCRRDLQDALSMTSLRDLWHACSVFLGRNSSSEVVMEAYTLLLGVFAQTNKARVADVHFNDSPAILRYISTQPDATANNANHLRFFAVKFGTTLNIGGDLIKICYPYSVGEGVNIEDISFRTGVTFMHTDLRSNSRNASPAVKTSNVPRDKFWVLTYPNRFRELSRAVQCHNFRTTSRGYNNSARLRENLSITSLTFSDWERVNTDISTQVPFIQLFSQSSLIGILSGIPVANNMKVRGAFSHMQSNWNLPQHVYLGKLRGNVGMSNDVAIIPSVEYRRDQAALYKLTTLVSKGGNEGMTGFSRKSLLPVITLEGLHLKMPNSEFISNTMQDSEAVSATKKAILDCSKALEKLKNVA